MRGPSPRPTDKTLRRHKRGAARGGTHALPPPRTRTAPHSLHRRNVVFPPLPRETIDRCPHVRIPSPIVAANAAIRITERGCPGAAIAVGPPRRAAVERANPYRPAVRWVPRSSMAAPPVEEGTMYAAALEIRHDCPIGKLSRRLPNLRIVQWCVDSRDLFQVSGPDDQGETFREDIVATFGGRQVYATGQGVIIVTQICRCGPPDGRGIGKVIRGAGAWDIPPLVYNEGGEA